MPKTGLSDKEWRERLKSYASGKFVYGRGQRPQKDTYWAKQVEKIERCPFQPSSSGSRDVFGRALTCDCGYHTDKVQTASNWFIKVQYFPSSVQTAGRYEP